MVQGIGGARYEEMIYHSAGQPQTITYLDEILPKVDCVPDFRIVDVPCSTPTDPPGVKGSAEGGTIGPPVAMANAVEDALVPFGVVVRHGPLSPNRLTELVTTAGSTAGVASSRIGKKTP